MWFAPLRSVMFNGAQLNTKLRALLSTLEAMWKWFFLSLVLLLVLLGIALFGPRTVLLASGGSAVATATEPAGPPWSDRLVSISVGGSNIFSVWKDFFDFPMFVYSFADARRFLCVYDDDTSVPVFVVDFDGPGTNASKPPLWPPDDYTRQVLEQRATNVVVNGKGLVRLPTYAEVREVSMNVKAWTPKQFKGASFPVLDLGFCRFRTSDKQFVLRALDTNRHSVWPTE